jgi:LacI family transcriptional regulator, galactose operon repressor
VKHTVNPERHRKPFSHRVGVRHIAESLGVSIATVDRALHDRPDVNRMTKARVLKVAQELGYHPNLAARFLRSSIPLRIAAVVPEELAAFFNEVRRGIDIAATQFAAAGMQVKYYDFPRLGVGEVEAFDRALLWNPRGLIVVPGLPGALRPLILRAPRAKVPVVCVNTDAPKSGRLTAVTMDPVFGGSTAAELIGRFTQGNGNVVLVTGALETSVHRRQVEAFRRTLTTLFPTMKITGVLEAHDCEEEAYQKFVATVRLKHKISAVYVSTANSAGVLRGLGDLGLLGNVTVVTTDLFPLLAEYIQSGAIAATLWQRPRSQGRMAVEMLFRFLAEGRCPRSTLELTPHVVLRSNLKRFMETLEFSDAAWFAPTLSSRGTDSAYS